MGLVRLRSGREVVIRPIRAEDGDGLRAAYGRLSPEAQHRRFLGPKPHLTASETRYLVQVDGSDHCARRHAGRPAAILAVGRFVRLPEDPQTAEIAVVVGDPFQREGLAAEMLERLAHAAVARGVVRFRATMLTGNRPAHELLRRLARGAAHERHRGPVAEIELELAPDPAASLR
jgi:RimJ/RimL family protein N-acetyltransferase